MPNGQKQYGVVGRLVWPVRPNVEKTSRVVEVSGSRYIVSLEFPTTYFVTTQIKVFNLNWCQVTVHWRQRFCGSKKAALTWAKSDNAKEALLDRMEAAQNAFIDVVKTTFFNNYDIHCVRHFGPLDWPYFGLYLAGNKVVERIGSSFGSHFRSIRTVLESLPDVCRQVSFEQRTLRRAVDLAQCGYPTESALLATAVLDATVQKVLKALMGEKHVASNSAEQLLRNVMTKRMATYLDGVLKLTCGRSLSEDEPALFARMSNVNRNRNDAIHNGKELARREAYEACNVAYEVINYLGKLGANWIPDVKEPKFFA